jgi:hypothetical protein
VEDTQREKIRLTRQDGEQDDVSVELLRAGRQRGVTSMFVFTVTPASGAIG